jgi:hypothetical protein
MLGDLGRVILHIIAPDHVQTLKLVKERDSINALFVHWVNVRRDSDDRAPRRYESRILGLRLWIVELIANCVIYPDRCRVHFS